MTSSCVGLGPKPNFRPKPTQEPIRSSLLRLTAHNCPRTHSHWSLQARETLLRKPPESCWPLIPTASPSALCRNDPGQPCCLLLPPGAALTKYHRPGGRGGCLKQQKSVFSQSGGWTSEIKVGAGWSLLEALVEGSVPCVSPSSGDDQHPWLVDDAVL